MDAANSPAGLDWASMTRAEFSADAPPEPFVLVEVSRPVPAVPDPYGTEALFGDVPAPRRAPRRQGREQSAPAQDDRLF